MRIVAVDSGTTFTRAWVVDEGRVGAGASVRAGARDLVGGRGWEWLADRVREVADQALSQAQLSWEEVEAVVAFGMITSELGLEELPHLKTPVDRQAPVGGMEERVYPDHLPVPTFLVPGVRYDGDGVAAHADFMRGEETEVIGMLEAEAARPPFLLLSTGSHSKFVLVDGEGRTSWSFTTLSGELLWALQSETILAGLIDPQAALDYGGTIDYGAMVEEGSRVARESGLSRALFVTRLLNRLEGVDPVACSAFVHGAVAEADLTSLESALPTDRPEGVVLTGSAPLTDAYRHLLEGREWARRVHMIDYSVGAMGAWALYCDR